MDTDILMNLCVHIRDPDHRQQGSIASIVSMVMDFFSIAVEKVRGYIRVLGHLHHPTLTPMPSYCTSEHLGECTMMGSQERGKALLLSVRSPRCKRHGNVSSAVPLPHSVWLESRTT